MKNHRFNTYLFGVCMLMVSVIYPVVTNAQNNSAPLEWLSGSPAEVSAGLSWGVPWPQGEVKSDATFSLTNGGKSLPLQSWPMAYWPDGSIKWTGFATTTDPSLKGDFEVKAGNSSKKSATEVKVKESDTTYEIDTGPLQVLISKWGGYLIRSMVVGGRTVARNGELVTIVQDGPETNPWDSPAREQFVSHVSKVTVEQSGPVRAVVKVEGTHQSDKNRKELIPFVVRFYFYANRTPVKMIHSIVYDGDQNQEMIKGLGIHFQVPMREEVQNRHIRFSGEGDGLWAEPVQPMVGRGGRFAKDPKTGKDVYPRQLEGQRVPNRADLDKQGQFFLADWAVWGDFKLVQPNADGFTIKKRTGPKSAWIPAGAGNRASGFVFAGDVSGGLGISLKDFWQSYPSSLEVLNAASGQADMYIWLWSPETPAMDMRHYDTKPHGLNSVYEDVQQGFSKAYGVARTSELTLYPTSNVPAKAELVKMAKQGAEPPVMVSTPEHYHSTGMFGFWSLPDRSTPFKKEIENQLDAYISYYQKTIEQRKWYGFWDYGDVMHSYDAVRHKWRYDLGGMAWQNTELMSDMWLWYSFLRTGREDIFHMAEAMSRHTQEVDVYHIGRFAGLGSRHNVRHWGGGAKEVRISQAPLKRFYHYLTTDERMGDLIENVARDAPQSIAKLDPMRLAMPLKKPEKFKYPGRIRLGPDWLAIAGDWMTMWEMTGDEKWKDKLYAGMNSISNFSLGFKTGTNLVVGFNPDTGELYPLSDESGKYNLATIQGGGEVGIEMTELVDNKAWKQTWLQFTRLRNAPKNVVLKDMKTHKEGADGSYTRPDRLAAYAYMKTKNPAFAKEAMKELASPQGEAALDTERVEGPNVLNAIIEADHVSTNTAAQWSLNAIEILEMCKDQIPKKRPEIDK